MTFYQVDTTIEHLREHAKRGGKYYKQVSAILSSQATTHNIQVAEELLTKLNKELNHEEERT